MTILGIGSGTSATLNQSVQALKNQLTVLQSQITTGEKSTTYAGMGVNEGFAIAARSQLASISGYSDAMTNINTNIGVANTALQSLADIGNTVQNSANGSSTTLNSAGQSIGQQTASAQLASMLGILNTQSGNSYLFSGSAVNTPSVASYNTIINGTTTQAGLQQVIAQREQADLGTTTIGASGLSGAVISSPTASSVQVTGNATGSPFAFTLSGASSTGSSATVTGPTGSPAAVSVALSTQPLNGDKFNFSFNLPDGTPEQIQLTALTNPTSPPATGTFGIDQTVPPSTATTAGNLSAALTTAIGALPVSLGRVAIASPTTTSVQLGGDSSPFGLKLSAVSATGTAVTTSGPAGSPAVGSVSLTTQPASGDQVSFSFKLPDGTTQQITLTATTTNPPPSGSYLIDPGKPTAVPPVAPSTAVTTSNLKTALAGAVWNLANTSLVASSATQAGNDFFSAGTATGSAVSSLSTANVANTLSSEGFTAGDTITVNGTSITFGTGANQIDPATATVQNLLSKIDSITGTSTPSTITSTASSGTITLHTDDAPDLSITSSNPSAMAALGFGSTISGTLTPLRVSGPPYNTATSLVSGTPANTASWYTGNQGPAGSARSSLTSRVDTSVTVQYGMQADEQSIRSQLQNLAVYSAVTTSPTNPIASQVVTALSQSVAQNLSPKTGQQSIEDIQSDLATAQVTMKDAQARQTQSQSTLQNLIDQTETVSTDQVASEILALQTSLSASYQTTSMLSQLTLTKYLPVG